MLAPTAMYETMTASRPGMAPAGAPAIPHGGIANQPLTRCTETKR